MIALAFFAGIILTAAVAILIVRGAKAPSQPPKPQRDLLVEMFDELTAKGARTDDRMRSLSVRTPERDADFWDIANHEPEAGRVEYRFLGITGFEDD